METMMAPVEVFYMFADDIVKAGPDSVWWDMLSEEEAFDPAHGIVKAAKSLEGWYFWTCHAGCIPDSDPIGPFPTEEEATAESQKDFD